MEALEAIEETLVEVKENAARVEADGSEVVEFVGIESLEGVGEHYNLVVIGETEGIDEMVEIVAVGR